MEIKIKKKYRNIKKNKTFKFKEKVNLIVGDNGSGKSSLLNLIRSAILPEYGYDGYTHSNKDMLRDYEDYIEILGHDQYDNVYDYSSDADNPLTSKGSGNVRSFFYNHGYDAMNSSYGEGQMINLNNIARRVFDSNGNNLIIFDEIDKGLSIMNRYAFAEMVLDLGKNNTVIVVSHNEYLLRKVQKVHNMNTQTYVKPARYFMDDYEMQIKAIRMLRRKLKTSKKHNKKDVDMFNALCEYDGDRVGLVKLLDKL